MRSEQEKQFVLRRERLRHIVLGVSACAGAAGLIPAVLGYDTFARVLFGISLVSFMAAAPRVFWVTRPEARAYEEARADRFYAKLERAYANNQVTLWVRLIRGWTWLTTDIERYRQFRERLDHPSD